MPRNRGALIVWLWRLMKPGKAIPPGMSMTSPSAGGSRVTSTTRPPSIKMDTPSMGTCRSRSCTIVHRARMMRRCVIAWKRAPRASAAAETLGRRFARAQPPRHNRGAWPLRAKRIFGRLYAARRSSVGQETIAEQLGAFVAQSRYENLPPTVVEKAKRHILDTFGAALAGATSEEAARTMAALSHTEGGGPAPVWGTAEQSSARNAALLNGIAAHAFELDDTGGCDHSGAVVLPAAVAALSLAQQPVSGRAFITAVVLGYDIGRRALESFGGYRPHNEAGWHSTGTCGTFGAAAAAANLFQLRAAEAKSSLGLGGSFSSGLWAFIHDGAMAKRVHAGRAAEGGLLAALLARAGVTGPAHVFEDVWGGFTRSFAPTSADPGAWTRDLGETWRIARVAIKPHAACRSAHSGIDAV